MKKQKKQLVIYGILIYILLHFVLIIGFLPSIYMSDLGEKHVDKFLDISLITFGFVFSLMMTIYLLSRLVLIMNEKDIIVAIIKLFGLYIIVSLIEILFFGNVFEYILLPSATLYLIFFLETESHALSFFEKLIIIHPIFIILGLWIYTKIILKFKK